ncbi:MAG: glycosyltransferase [Chitinophagaceae bacterium]|nr:glycosyltransferase [Chitinophagaceae bacterium]
MQCTLIDAMPLSVVEAMAMARPCVVSNVGDMPAWIKDGISGFICKDITEAGIEQHSKTAGNKKTTGKCWAKMPLNVL